MTIPTRFRPGAKALIVKDGKILVIKENVPRRDAFLTIYDFPGGGLELGETVVEALHREVFEEVGLQVEVVKPVGSWDFVVSRDNEVVHIICLAFQCQLVGDSVIDTTKNPAAEDITEALWLTPAEMAQIPVEEWSADIRPTLLNVNV